MKKLKMFCLCIHDELYHKIKSLNYIPVGLGNKIYNEGWLRDNTMQNISAKNKSYGEYTFHYWFWKNQLLKKKDKNWVGFCAYRRFWLKKNSKPYLIKNLQKDVLQDVPEIWDKYEVILGNQMDISGVKIMKLLKFGKISLLKNPKAITKKGRTIKFHFDMFHGNGVLDKAIDLLENRDMSDFKEYVSKKNSYNQGNMFICNSKHIMDDYYETLFKWLDKFENIHGHNYSSYGTSRIYAFLAERFLPYWFSKYTKYLEWPIGFYDTKRNN